MLQETEKYYVDKQSGYIFVRNTRRHVIAIKPETILGFAEAYVLFKNGTPQNIDPSTHTVVHLKTGVVVCMLSIVEFNQALREIKS